MSQRDPAFPHYDGPTRVERLGSFDGTELCYTVYGGGERTIVLSPGLATPPTVYDYLVERFASRYRFVTWDMRGSFRSDRPATGAAAQRVEDSASDLEVIVEAEQLERFVLGGWSMGVQVSLEYVHRHPGRVEGLILINGGYGRVLDHVYNSGVLGRGLQAMLAQVVRAPRLLDRLAKTVLAQQWFIDALFATDVITANRPFVTDVIGQFRTLDFGYYFPMMRQLHAHSAEGWLGDVLQPTLITAGTKDQMTPVSSARTMAERLPDAELVVFENGTHYTPIEYPDVMNEAVATFLDRVWAA